MKGKNSMSLTISKPKPIFFREVDLNPKLFSHIAKLGADIFYNNCFKNSILPIELDKNVVEHLFGNVHVIDHYKLTINLEEQEIYDDLGESWNFEIDGSKKETLLKGLDDISQTLLLEQYIDKHESAVREKKPWKLPRQI